MFIEDRYEVLIDDTVSLFEFVSEGKNGKIKKVVRYNETNLKGMYNLGFGDYDEVTGLIDDKVITDNGDSEKVLATVAATVWAFIEMYPKGVHYSYWQHSCTDKALSHGNCKISEQNK